MSKPKGSPAVDTKTPAGGGDIGMEASQFADLLSQVKNAGFSATKLEIIKLAVTTNAVCFLLFAVPSSGGPHSLPPLVLISPLTPV